MTPLTDLQAAQRIDQRLPGRADGVRISARDADEVARRINALNARRTARAQAAVHFMLGLVFAILAAAALLHWLTPCDVATLCAGGATLVPTRSATWWQRWLRPLRRWYVRRLLAAAEFDAWYHEETLHTAPRLRDLAETRAAELRAELALLHA